MKTDCRVRVLLAPTVLTTVAAVAAVAVLAASCGKKESDPTTAGGPAGGGGAGGAGGGGAGGGAQGRIALKFKQAETKSLSLAGEAVGTNDAAGLESLSYLLSSIQLFREGSLQQTGSGWSITKPGWELFKNNPEGVDYNAFEPEQAASKRSLFIDFLDPLAIEKISKNATYSSDQVGKYTTASINWYRPFFVKCKVELSNGTILHTKKSTGLRRSGTGLNTQITTLVDNMDQGPAEEAPAMLANGGSFSSFGKPFEITAEDVEKKTEFKLVLAYRPEGMCQGFSQNSQSGGIKFANHPDAGLSPNLDTVPTIQVKFLDLVPIVARKGEPVSRDTYRLSVKSAVDEQGTSVLDASNQPISFSASQRVLMDVYRVATDDVRGVNFTVVSPEGGAGTNLIGPARPNAVTFTGGKLSGTDWTGSKVVDAFELQKNVGDKADLAHESCVEYATDMKSCAKKVNVVYEAEFVESTVLDAK